MYKFAINRPITTLMFFVSLLFFGIFSLRTMSVNLYPEVDIPIIMVTTYADGDMSFIKSKVTQKIEDEIASIEGIKKIYSNSFDNLSLVTIEFDLKKNIEAAANDVRDRMAKARINGSYKIEKLSGGGSAIFSLFISAKDGNATKLMKKIDDEAKPFLQRIPGVGRVKEVGFLQPQIRIFLDPFLLDKFSLTARDIANIINVQNLRMPLGKIENNATQISIKSNFDARKISELENLRLANGIFLKDVARVEFSHEDEDSIALMKDVKGVMLQLEKVSGANALKTIQNAKARLDEFRRLLGDGYSVTVAFDKSLTMMKNIRQVGFDMVLGVMLTMVIVFVFLRNFSSTLISVIAIPTSIIGTFFIMDVLGYDINRLTLIALTLGIGIFVDDAIVVIENITKKMQDIADPLKASFEGIKEIAFSVLGISSVLLCVFIPIAFMSGIIGKYFNSFAMSVSAGIVVSFLVSVMLIPSIAARFISANESAFWHKTEPFFEFIENSYERLLGVILKFKITFIVLSLLALFVSMSLARFIGGDFMPTEDNSEFDIFFKADPSITPEAMRAKLEGIMSKINADERVEYAYLLIGYTDARQAYLARGYVRLKELGKRKDRQSAIMEQYRNEFKREGLSLTVADLPVVEGGDTQPVQLIITGSDNKILDELTPKVRAMLENIGGVVDISSPNEDKREQIEISIDKDKAKRLQITEQDIASTIYRSFSSNLVSSFDDSRQQYDIYMRFDDKFRGDINSLKRLKIKNALGEQIALSDIAKFSEVKSQPSLDRFNRENQLKFLANIYDIALNKVSNDVSAHIGEFLPQGYKYRFLGFIELMNDTNAAFIFTISLSAVLIYMILAALYESFMLPFIIMISMPLAFGGVVLGLFLSGNSFSLFVMVGAILLFGMVGKNAILVVDFANKFANEGMSIDEAVIKAGKRRLRAILMTTFAMIFAMLPLAFSRGAGYEGNSPMAISIISGLVSSTVLTLLIVPALFEVVYKLDKKLRKFYERAKFED
ncbi:efflux RND transporter permease subunit [Campylobacter curvus]|uniref:efflux RND transporter permease subunit n=1 Tax=Campylobacter curvus TaxID=200 RepID=UPI00146FD960|nr:efflux RND transporter permease subunit [Campylobacter curvus]